MFKKSFLSVVSAAALTVAASGASAESASIVDNLKRAGVISGKVEKKTFSIPEITISGKPAQLVHYRSFDEKGNVRGQITYFDGGDGDAIIRMIDPYGFGLVNWASAKVGVNNQNKVINEIEKNPQDYFILREGKGIGEIYIISEPNCPACAKFHKRAKASGLTDVARVNWVLTSFINPRSKSVAGPDVILEVIGNARDPLAALGERYDLIASRKLPNDMEFIKNYPPKGDWTRKGENLKKLFEGNGIAVSTPMVFVKRQGVWVKVSGANPRLLKLYFMDAQNGKK